MLLHNAPLFEIYFGSAKDELPRKLELTLNQPPEIPLLQLEPFSNLKKMMPLEQLLFVRQVHGTDGLVVTQENAEDAQPFAQDGDYLSTNVPGVGIGVLTADCLPIVFYDSRQGAASVIHAGWRGSVAGIACIALEQMQQEFDTKLENIKVFFGPSAKPCCYEVSQDFVQHLDPYPFAQDVLISQADKLFFDVPGFNRHILESIGVRKESFRFEYNLCTICDDTFCSYRREGQLAGSQMTVICLK
jgi:YfiH family protein